VVGLFYAAWFGLGLYAMVSGVLRGAYSLAAGPGDVAWRLFFFAFAAFCFALGLYMATFKIMWWLDAESPNTLRREFRYLAFRMSRNYAIADIVCAYVSYLPGGRKTKASWYVNLQMRGPKELWLGTFSTEEAAKTACARFAAATGIKHLRQVKRVPRWLDP